MGLWGVLWEIVKAVAPHTVPHVARAVTNAAKDRRADELARLHAAPADDLYGRVESLEQRLEAAERRAATAEMRLAAYLDEFSRKWESSRKWIIALLAWNALVTAALLFLLFRHR
jgi:hypothetical protein